MRAIRGCTYRAQGYWELHTPPPCQRKAAYDASTLQFLRLLSVGNLPCRLSKYQVSSLAGGAGKVMKPVQYYTDACSWLLCSTGQDARAQGVVKSCSSVQLKVAAWESHFDTNSCYECFPAMELVQHRKCVLHCAQATVRNVLQRMLCMLCHGHAL